MVFRIHFGLITGNQVLLSVIDELRTNTLSRVRQIRVSNICEGKQAEVSGPFSLRLLSSRRPPFQDVMGFNSAALLFLQREIESKEDVMFFADATGRLKEKKTKRRKRERAVLTVA